MSFIQLQQAKSCKDGRVLTYVNLAESVRKPGAKHPQQKRIYLGLLMNDGDKVKLSKRFAGGSGTEVSLSEIKKRVKAGENVSAWLMRTGRSELSVAAGHQNNEESIPKSVEIVGQTYLMGNMASEIKLTDCLINTFGETNGQALLALAEHQVAEGRPLYLAKNWIEESAIPKDIASFDFSSVGLSGFMEQIGGMSKEIETFFKNWADACGKPSSLIFDTTSLSTYASRLSLAEWGYNRDGDSLQQINFSLVSGRENNLPLFYRLVPGSIPDVTLLRQTVTRLQDIGIKEFTCALDRGFYSAGNVRALLTENIDFVLGAPLSCSQARELIQKHKTVLASIKRSISFQGRVLRHIEDVWSVDLGKGQTRQIVAHIYLDPERRTEAVTSIERRVFQLERKLQEEIKAGHIEDLQEAKEWVAKHAGLLISTLSVQRNEDSSLQVERCPHAIALLTAHKGYTIIITNKENISGEKIISDYRARDTIEKMFDILKNETSQNRIRSGKDEVAAGRLFLAFLGMIIHQSLENRLKLANLIKYYSVAEVLSELRKVKSITTAVGRKLLLEITKKQKDLFTALGVDLPS